MPTSQRVSLWLPVLLWAMVIFGLSAIPSLSTGLGTWDLILRKGAHVTEYAGLGALLLRAFGREWPALLAGVAYAGTDEIHQHFVPGRAGRPLDAGIDTIGLVVGILLFKWALERTRARLAR